MANLYDVAEGIENGLEVAGAIEGIENQLSSLEGSDVEGMVQIPSSDVGAPPKRVPVRVPVRGSTSLQSLKVEVAKLKSAFGKLSAAYKAKGIKGVVEAISRSGTRCLTTLTWPGVAAAGASTVTVTPQGNLTVSALVFVSNTPGRVSALQIGGQNVIDGSTTLTLNDNGFFVQELNEPIQLNANLSLTGTFNNEGAAAGSASMHLVPKGSMFNGVRY